MRRLDGHEIAPAMFTSRENVAAKKKAIQDIIDVANETAGKPRDEKQNMIKTSVKRAKQT